MRRCFDREEQGAEAWVWREEEQRSTEQELEDEDDGRSTRVTHIWIGERVGVLGLLRLNDANIG